MDPLAQVPLIAFSGADEEFHFQIYVAPIDGSSSRRVGCRTTSPEYWPVWSPDGGHLLFESAGDLCVVCVSDWSCRLVEGGGKIQYPRWMPDGEHVLFYERATPLRWYLMDTDGRNRRPLFKGLGSIHVEPSPDGALFAVSTGDAAGGFFVRSEQGDIEQVAAGYSVVEAPTWSPNGEYIAFTALDETGEERCLFVLHRASGVVRMIDALANEGYFAWAPDSRQLAYTGTEEYQDFLYLADRDGSAVRQLGRLNEMDTSGEMHVDHPSWSPDGSFIAIGTCALEDGGMAIDIYSAQGHLDRRLLPRHSLINTVTWQPLPQRSPGG